MDENSYKSVAVSTSNPNIKDKMHYKLKPDSNTIYWYIKFNILLDESSITEKTMYVTDLAGYKMHTHIEYSEENNIISISPIDTYSKNMYYILKINKKVKSKKGNKLKKDINIVFKLVNDELHNFEVLKYTTEVPTAMQRPKNYDPENVESKVEGFDNNTLNKNSKSNKKNKDNFQYLPFKINPFIGIIGLLLVVIGLITSVELAILGAFISAVGAAHLFLQITNGEKRSVYTYNKGVKKFRSGEYDEASKLFNKAFELDRYNNKIEFAKSRIKNYISK